uniref:Ninein-like n=1 Tax=Salmo trutta TaxID=8032 RepID=A0A673XH28_SALTR
MDEEEQNRYVAQLKEEFDSCDTTGTGYLDKEELSSLCHKLSLDAHLPLLLDTLLGPHHYARVNFEEFKEGFVAVLSRSLDFSTSEEESSYLEPVVPEEVKPKFVKGTKRYGRRSRPDRPDSELPAELEDSPPFRTEQKELSPAGVRRAKLRRSTSLESVESLKSDEETGSQKDTIHQTFEAQGQQKRWKRDSSGSSLQSPGPGAEVSDSQMRAVWEELGVGGGGFLNRQELSLVCDHLGLQDLNSEELDALFRKLDTDLDGRVSLRKFQKGLFREKGVPVPTSSTPIRHNPHRSLQQAFEERIVRSTSPSLLSATVGQRLLTRLDDGSGCTSPERVITLWNEEGIKNSRDILQVSTLDFSLEERVSLAELTLALDNELLVSGNGIHQAALISYKNEIQFLQVLADQACQERDKVKADLEWADRRNLQLVREVDDRHTTIESLNETKIKGLEQEFRDRLSALRSESEQESEVLLQQVERERAKLKEEVEVLHAQDASLQEEICNENRCLEEEGSVLKGKLSEAENNISKLQRDLDQLLLDKFGSLDPNNTGLLNQEERFSEIIKEYELQCRELRDRNDELNSEVEMLKSQEMGRRPRRARDTSTHAWSSRRSLTTESDSDDPEMKIGESPMASKKLQVANKNGLGCLESLPSLVVSIETEMAMEQFKERHSQEVQDLKIELETKVNFYERSLELMRRNMEVERKDISSGFKVEISELEEQKAQAEEQVKRLREAVEKLQAELQSSSRGQRGPGWGADQERRAQREQAELEQNYAREISNLVQRLTSEKDQLEAELKLKMDQDLLIVSSQLDEVNCENSALKDRLAMLQQDVQRMEEEIIKKKKKLDEVEQEHEKNREKQERLHKDNAKYQEEVLDLRARNLQLSGENAELSSRLRADQGAVQMLTERLAQVSREQEEGAATARQLQETYTQQERERLHLEKELHTVKEKSVFLMNGPHLCILILKCLVESSLTSLTLKHQWLEQDKERLLREVEERTQKVEKLQESLLSVGSQMELLRSQLQAVDQEKTGQTQEVANQQRMIQDAQDKVKELEASMGRLSREKEQLRLAQKQHEEEATMALQKECQSLRLQNQELLHRVELRYFLLNLTEECLTLKNKQTQLDTARAEAQDQALMVDTALTLAQAQHVRELQQLREQAGLESREQLAYFQAQLADEKRRGQKLQQTLRTQAQQASTQIGLQQEQYEKVMGNMQERMEGVETKLRSVRKLLQEKVNQLKEQLAKNAKSDIMLKDLYVENSQLMKALQVTEQRQKSAEKNNFVLEEKITALNKLIRKITPASLSA